MKATVNPQELLKELKKMSLVVNKTTVIPILSCALFDFKKDNLTITATDLETTFITSLDCECKEPFKVPIDFQDIVSIVTNLIDPLEITLTKDSLNIVSGRSKFKRSLFGENEHFPIQETEDAIIEFDANGDFFYHLSIANTCKNADDPRMSMPAIDIDKNSITLVGTDSNLLYKKELPIKTGKNIVTMISSNFVGSCKSFQDSKIYIGEKFIKAEYLNQTVISRLSEQKFPTYRVVIKNDIEYNLSIDKNKLKFAVTSVSNSANQKYSQVILSFKEGLIELKSYDIDLGKEGETEIDIEHSVEIPQISFNAHKLLHLLNSMDSEIIYFSFTGESQSINIKPHNDESVFALLQPVVIQQKA